MRPSKRKLFHQTLDTLFETRWCERKNLLSGLRVRYLYQPSELEGGRRRATDSIWSLKVYEIEKIMIKPNAPVLYYLFDGPKRGFVGEELLVVPPDTQRPPAI